MKRRYWLPHPKRLCTVSTLEDKLSIAVTFDPARGYVSTHPELQTSRP